MKNRNKRRNLRSIRTYLKELMQIETMEPGQSQEVLEAFNELHRADASGDRIRKMRATARIARLFVEVASNTHDQ